MTRTLIGVDVHKRNHTFVAVDANGVKLGSKTVAATTSGHFSALRWARKEFTNQRLWAVEDVRPLSTRLEHQLLEANEAVVRVPSKLTARQRASARSHGKSDPIDALAVARAALREPDLPIARHDDVSRGLKLLVDRRDRLVATRTATTNRLRMRLHEIDPEMAPALGQLRYVSNRRLILDGLERHTSLLAEMAREETLEVGVLTDTVKALAERITSEVQRVAPSLLKVPGCGALTAAKIVGETADITRFASEPKFACYAGVAPIPYWSASSTGGWRAVRYGNRQLNMALHTIALSQIRKGARGEPYYRRRLDEGDSHAQALRCLKRRLSRVVYRCLTADHHARHHA